MAANSAHRANTVTDLPLAIDSISFDLDGTMLDTVPDLGLACNRMLNDLGMPPFELDEISNFVGQGVGHLVACCLSRDGKADENQLATGLEMFRHHYAVTNGQGAKLYPGVAQGLKTWQSLGLPMAVITNKPQAFTLPLLESTGLRNFFSVIVSGDTTAEKKPHPQPIHYACRALGSDASRHLHIGDSRHDIASARAAGCYIWCVPYGYHGADELCEGDCDAMVPDLLVAARMFSA